MRTLTERRSASAARLESAEPLRSAMWNLELSAGCSSRMTESKTPLRLDFRQAFELARTLAF